MREEFYREEENTKVLIEVAPAAYGYSQRFGWLFSVFIKFDPWSLHVKEQEREEFLDAKESIIVLLEHNEDAKYAGSRIVDGWSELYFYTKDSKLLSQKIASILSTLQYPHETNVVKDAKWDFYHHNLFPSELEGHGIRSERILQMLEEEGDDLSKQRPVEHYVYFDTPTQKEKFLKKLPWNDFVYKDEIDLEDFDNGIALEKVHALDKDTIAMQVKQIYEKVTQEYGYYEGWSTVLAGEDA